MYVYYIIYIYIYVERNSQINLGEYELSKR